MRGYYGIGILNIKNRNNLGTLWRSAFNFGASFIFTIGARYKHQKSDTVKTYRHIPFYQYDEFDDFYKTIPKDCRLIGIEDISNAIDLRNYQHCERSIYLLGAEDYGLPGDVILKCSQIIKIDSIRCLNVSVAGSIVMYDRLTKNEIKLDK